MLLFETIALLLIIALATFDLWVGVANDAVNFLNSAFGSRVARRRVIVIIAAAGILFGALTSSGLMEVARRGVFDPSHFVNAQGAIILTSILALYLGVMAADVLLLDFFNTFGLPTSTTVSIVSELVGASIAVAFWTNGGGIGGALGVINSGPVLGIYSAISLSVVTAFVGAAVVMFLVRVVYGHDLGASFPRWGWLWTGIAFAAMAYFVLFKGLQGAAILDDETMSMLRDRIVLILGGVFALAGGLAVVWRRHPAKVIGAIVLTGRGALSIAFAGNDLVNFIGPSVAAFQAVLRRGRGPLRPRGHPAMGAAAGRRDHGHGARAVAEGAARNGHGDSARGAGPHATALRDEPARLDARLRRVLLSGGGAARDAGRHPGADRGPYRAAAARPPRRLPTICYGPA